MERGVLLLSNNENVWHLFTFLQQQLETVLFSGRLTLDLLKKISPQLIVSYNYQYIISEDIIDFMQGRIINLHISLLPWNRGSSPNFWSFIEDTPKGVTIHRIGKGLDTGDIIFQKELFFDEDRETFSSTYDRLQVEIVKLFKENWQELYDGTYTIKMQEGMGTYHTQKNMKEFLKDKDFSLDMKISEFKRKYC